MGRIETEKNGLRPTGIAQCSFAILPLRGFLQVLLLRYEGGTNHQTRKQNRHSAATRLLNVKTIYGEVCGVPPRPSLGSMPPTNKYIYLFFLIITSYSFIVCTFVLLLRQQTYSESVFVSFVGNSQFQRQRDYDNSIRSCIGHVVSFLFRGATLHIKPSVECYQ